MTYTYAILDVSLTTFNEIRAKLDAAGYQHAFDRDVIDMHGIAVRAEPVVRAATKRHKTSCPAYGNYQLPYEDCTCGAE